VARERDEGRIISGTSLEERVHCMARRVARNAISKVHEEIEAVAAREMERITGHSFGFEVLVTAHRADHDPPEELVDTIAATIARKLVEQAAGGADAD